MKFAFGSKLLLLRHICIMDADALLLFEYWQCNANLVTEVTAADLLLRTTQTI